MGSTREEAFRNAGRALLSLAVDLDSVGRIERVPITARAAEPGELLVNWLGEILYLQDAEGWLFADFEDVSVTDRTASGSGCGERFERGRHQIKLMVKAITYHQLVLEKRPDGVWRAQVYVDI